MRERTVFSHLSKKGCQGKRVEAVSNGSHKADIEKKNQSCTNTPPRANLTPWFSEPTNLRPPLDLAFFWGGGVGGISRNRLEKNRCLLFSTLLPFHRVPTTSENRKTHLIKPSTHSIDRIKSEISENAGSFQ